MSKQPAVETTAVSLFGAKTDVIPAHLQAQVGDAGLGNESVTSDDMTMPVLSVLQPISKELEDIEGAKAGQMCLNITGELLDRIYVVNLMYTKDYAVFRKRNRGGGFHGKFETVAEANALIATLPGSAADYDAVETANHIVLLLDDAGMPRQPALLRLKSTMLTVSRNWNAAIATNNGEHARFATVWELKTAKKSNDKGTWYVLDPQFAGWAGEELYNKAKETFLGFREVPPVVADEA